MGGTLVRTIFLVLAKAEIGKKNLGYNMRRLAQFRHRPNELSKEIYRNLNERERPEKNFYIPKSGHRT